MQYALVDPKLVTRKRLRGRYNNVKVAEGDVERDALRIALGVKTGKEFRRIRVKARLLLEDNGIAHTTSWRDQSAADRIKAVNTLYTFFNPIFPFWTMGLVLEFTKILLRDASRLENLKDRGYTSYSSLSSNRRPRRRPKYFQDDSAEIYGDRPGEQEKATGQDEGGEQRSTETDDGHAHNPETQVDIQDLTETTAEQPGAGQAGTPNSPPKTQDLKKASNETFKKPGLPASATNKRAASRSISRTISPGYAHSRESSVGTDAGRSTGAGQVVRLPGFVAPKKQAAMLMIHFVKSMADFSPIEQFTTPLFKEGTFREFLLTVEQHIKPNATLDIRGSVLVYLPLKDIDSTGLRGNWRMIRSVQSLVEMFRTYAGGKGVYMCQMETVSLSFYIALVCYIANTATARLRSERRSGSMLIVQMC